MNPEQLRLAREKRECVEEMQRISDQADAEGRDRFSAEEQVRWNELDRKAESLTQRIEAIGSTRRAEVEAKINAHKRPTNYSGDRDFLRGHNKLTGERDFLRPEVGGDRITWTDPNGNALNVLRPTEKLLDESTLPSGMKHTDLSIGRYVRGVITGNWRGCDAEREVMATSGSTTSNSNAGYMVDSTLAKEWIDRARAESTIMASGARTLEMPTGEMRLAVVTGDPTIGIHGENELESVDNPTLGMRTLVAKTLMGLCQFSKELLQDSANGSDLISSVLVNAMAAAIDQQCLAGTGSDEMLGLLSYPGVNTVAVGGTLTYLKLVEAMKELYADNHRGSSYIIDPEGWYDLAAALVNSEANHHASPPSAVARELQELVSSACTSGSGVVLDGTNVLLGVRQTMTIGTSDSAGTAFERNQQYIRITMRADMVLADPLSVCTLTGIA